MSSVAIVLAVWFTSTSWRRDQFSAPYTVPPRVSRLQITPSGSAALTISGGDRDLAITPDGSRVVYVGNNGLAERIRKEADLLREKDHPHTPES